MLFTDTDSLPYEKKSKDVYEESFKHKLIFLFSNFLNDSKLCDTQNKMFVGKMKVKPKGIPIKKFVRLKLKMYSMLSDDGKESHAAK